MYVDDNTSDMESDLIQGSSLTSTGEELKADVILSNPPFGTAKGGGGATHTSLLLLRLLIMIKFLQLFIVV